jgi:hypothetical protein
MTLAQVQAVVAALFAIIATLTGLLTSVTLLLPKQANGAAQALDEAPKRCFWKGLALLAVAAFAFGGLSRIPAPLIKFVCFAILMGIAGLVTLGCAGMALLMGRRIGEMSGARSSLGCLVRGSLAYSIGIMFPIVGWWLLMPLSVLCAGGAGLTALRSTRAPRAVANRFEGQGAV